MVYIGLLILFAGLITGTSSLLRHKKISRTAIIITLAGFGIAAAFAPPPPKEAEVKTISTPRPTMARQDITIPRDPAPPVAKCSSWQHETTPDDVSQKPIETDTLMSDTMHNLGFPYSGGTTARLILRHHPRYGNDILFGINKGQLICAPYEGCAVTVRFDNDKPVRVHANIPADYDTTTLFLHGNVMNKIKHAKMIVVEATFYQEGERAFVFKTDEPLAKVVRGEKI